MEKSILITGATGLVGGHLLIKLLNEKLENTKITALIRKTSSLDQLKKITSFYNYNFDKIYNSVNWIYGDTLDYISLCKELENINEVYHCAAMVSMSNKNAEKMMLTNVRGTANIVDAAIKNKVQKFCFVSSIGAFGMSEDTPITEESARPNRTDYSAYSISKFKSENEVWRGIQEGLNAVIVNPGIILGPGSFDKGSMLLFKAAQRGIPFYTDSINGYVDVRDLVTTMIKLMDSNFFKERYIIVCENISNKELFTLISKEFGKKAPCIKANHILLSISVALATIYATLFNKEVQLNKNTLHSAETSNTYSNRKIVSTLKYNFIPLKKTIKDICNFYKKFH